MTTPTGALHDLLAEVSGPVRPFIGDGAHDCVPTAAAIRHAFGPDVELIILPPKNAVPGDCQTRDAHIHMITGTGRMAWQKATGYGRRSRSRNMGTQTTETRIAVNALNCTTHLGRSAYKRVGLRTGERGECGPSAIRATQSFYIAMPG